MFHQVAEQDKLASLIRDGNLFAVLATFFGLGILLSFTPCVLPTRSTHPCGYGLSANLPREKAGTTKSTKAKPCAS